MANGHGVATVNFGTTPTLEGSFTVTDASVSIGDSIECWSNAGDSTSATGNDNTVDAHKFAAVSFRFQPSLGLAGSFTVDIISQYGYCSGYFKIRYAYAT